MLTSDIRKEPCLIWKSLAGLRNYFGFHWTYTDEKDLFTEWFSAFMVVPTPEKAELVGVLLGDGCISHYPSSKYSDFYRVKVTLDSQEEQYAIYVRRLFYSCLGVTALIRPRRGERAVDICVFRRSVVESLLSWGLLLSPKWGRAVIPEEFMQVEWGCYVLRGYMDTDGSLVRTVNNGLLYPRIEFKVMPSPMQKQLLALLDLYGFRYSAYTLDKGKIRVQINGLKMLSRWAHIIGFSNDKHRKKCFSFLG